MPIAATNILEKLDEVDKEKVTYFIKLLLNKSHYQKLKEEICLRKDEITKNETITHSDVWDSLNV